MLLACCGGTFLRIFINNNFITSILGSLFFGFLFQKGLVIREKKLYLVGFFHALHPLADSYIHCTKFLIKEIGLNL